MGGRRWRTPSSPLRAEPEGMLHPEPGAARGRPPQQVPGAMATAGIYRSGRPEAAPAELSRGEQNPVPLQGKQNGRRRPPGRGSGRLRDLGHLLSFRGMTLPVGALEEPKRPEIRPTLPTGGARRRAQPTSAAAQRAPFLAAAAQPIAQTRRVLSTAWVAACY